MAGRPAVARGGGLTGVHYGLIAFVIVSVLALAGFIFALTNLKRAQDEAADARRRLSTYGSPPGYYADEAANRNSTVFAVMQDELAKLAELVTGRPQAVWRTIEQDAARVRGEVARESAGAVKESDPLLGALTALHRALLQARQNSAALTRQVEDLQGQVQALREGVQAARDEYAAQVKELNDRVAQLEREKNEALQAKDRQLAELTAEATARAEEFNRERLAARERERDKDARLARLAAQVESLQKQIQELKPSLLDPGAILTKADGRIQRAIPGSDIVYISLGQQDHVKPGMGFEVFPQTPEPTATYRGKASIEVVAVMPQSSECRVRRTTPGRPIVEGDIVVNLAYERGRRPRFVVRGDFDLNYDGVIDFDGAEKVAGIIREWGGQVAAELDPTVDFVVVGVPPQVPEVDQRQRTAVMDALAEQRSLEQSRFRKLIDEARALYIPVITQSQFLFLTGHAGPPGS